MTDLIPRRDTVIGRFITRGPASKVLWTPGENEHQPILMHVDFVGRDVTEIQQGDLVLLAHDWAGAELNIEEDDGYIETYIVVRESDIPLTTRARVA